MILVVGAMLMSFAAARAANDPNSSDNSKSKKANSSATAGKSSSPAAAPASAPAATPAPAAAASSSSTTTASASASVTESSVDNYGLLPTTGGPLGLFTVASGNVLPAHGWSVSAYGNRFGRMPGELVVSDYGFNLAYGFSNWLEVYAEDITISHMHVGAPTELTDLTTTGFNTPHAVYNESYPYARESATGEGPFTLGAKVGLASEDRGDPVSVALNLDVVVQSHYAFAPLADQGTQNGKANLEFGASVSKNFQDNLTLDFDAEIGLVRSPTYIGTALLNQAKTFTIGGGVLLFPHKRIQPMTEYTGVMYYGDSTETESFGPRDPVDGVWGVRLFPISWLGFDLGYRYMLNEKHLQDSNGFVFKVGAVHAPHKAPPVDHPPTVSCTADPTSVYFGSGDSSAVNCPAVSPDNDTLTYNWTSTCGKIDGTGPAVHWLSAGVPIGTCTATVHVDDGHGGTVSGSADIQVIAKPKHPPVISCSSDRSSVFIGEKIHITANASSPDGDTLTFTWQTNGGTIIGTGSAVDLDTTGAAAGNYTVTGRVDDGNGGAADCSVAVQVNAPPPPPQASKLSECLFSPAGSSRVDNVCKRILDDVALRLQNDPKATIVIVGFADPKEPRPAKLGALRATNAVKYLGEKGIDASRITTRAGAGQTGAGKENRRIDVIWVPEGATY
jgi:outer membrane protein OmpA-like peptidoglycan-associated protein